MTARYGGLLPNVLEDARLDQHCISVVLLLVVPRRIECGAQKKRLIWRTFQRSTHHVRSNLSQPQPHQLPEAPPI
jgi:hypothetical protein